MIRELDTEIAGLLKAGGGNLATANIAFDLPDTTWQAALPPGLSVNCYLYDVRENLEMRTNEMLTAKNATGQFVRVPAPVRIDCAYCITAWSTDTTGSATADEHDLLSQILSVLFASQPLGKVTFSPYPSEIASDAGIVKHHPEFWTAIGQKLLKPSITYVVTLAMVAPTPTKGCVPVSQVLLYASQPTGTATSVEPTFPPPGVNITETPPESPTSQPSTTSATRPTLTENTR